MSYALEHQPKQDDMISLQVCTKGVVQEKVEGTWGSTKKSFDKVPLIIYKQMQRFSPRRHLEEILSKSKPTCLTGWPEVDLRMGQQKFQVWIRVSRLFRFEI